MRKLNLTDKILDKLGFSEYWDEHGTWGSRTLIFENGITFTIIEQEEMNDCTEGYGNAMYVAHHFYFAGWFTQEMIEENHDLFFLHEMYECIEKYYPSCLNEFIEKCNSLNMKIYIDDFIKTKRDIIN